MSIRAAADIAAQIGARKPEQRDSKILAKARSAVILAFGRALSGAPTAIAKALLNTPGVAFAGGPSLVLGTERRTSALDAALVNAAAAMAGPDAAIDAANAGFVVSVFGLCEARAVAGQAFLDALISSAEISATVAPMAGPYDAAAFGSTVAAARLLELNPAQIAAALAASGIANPGSERLPLAVGLRIKNGLLAALLAQTMDDASCAEMTRNTAAFDVPVSATPAAFDLLAVRSPPGADLWDQFEAQVSAVLPRDHIAPLFERLETIDKVTDLGTVSRLLQAGRKPVSSKKVVFAARGTHEPEETNWVP